MTMIKNRYFVLCTAIMTLLENTDNVMFIKDADLVYMACTDSFARMARKETAEYIIGRTDF